MLVTASPSLPTSTNAQRTQTQISLGSPVGPSSVSHGPGSASSLPIQTGSPSVAQGILSGSPSISLEGQSSTNGLESTGTPSLHSSLRNLILFFAVRRRRWRRRRHDAAAARTVSPFMRLISPSDAARNDASRVRLQYLEEELSAAQTEIQEIRDHNTEGQPPAAEEVGPETETESDGERNEVSLLMARIHELETQMSSAWALGLSEDAPPGYTA
ncbi:hypothetical protein FB451DRAFT_1376112 [Mycena latifolia]|nr:hypothetical protein FB451DRAFT_1376112 [Mycena latifolia]